MRERRVRNYPGPEVRRLADPRFGTRVALHIAMLEHSASRPSLNSERDVVGQIKLAFSNPLPLLIGALIGALVPVATYTVGHAELAVAGWGSVPGAIVIGGCLFSAITVYKWGRRAFDSALKALGFVVLSEGVMTFSQTPWLSLLMLIFLVAINAIANGANLAVAHLDAERLRTLEVVPVIEPVPAPVIAPVVGAVPVVTGPAVEAAPEATKPAPKKPARKRAPKAKGRVTTVATERLAAGELN